MRRFRLLTQEGYNEDRFIKGTIYNEDYYFGSNFSIIDLVKGVFPEDWEEVFTSEWISVSDRLPNPGEEVFAVDEFEEYHACKYEGYWGFVHDEKKIYPTHWMPIPSLPKR